MIILLLVTCLYDAILKSKMETILFLAFSFFYIIISMEDFPAGYFYIKSRNSGKVVDGKNSDNIK
jgi:uncharacterized protein YqgC (DUF456 family)